MAARKTNKPRKLESSEQIKFVNRVRQFYPDILVFAIPNGGNRSAQEATKFKEEGVLAGVPDLMIARKIGRYNGLFVEMKREKIHRPKVSDEQKAMMKRLTAEGYLCLVGYGCEDAWRQFEAIMKHPELL